MAQSAVSFKERVMPKAYKSKNILHVNSGERSSQLIGENVLFKWKMLFVLFQGRW